MHLRHILAAADESDAGRRAVRTAMELANRSSARVTVLRVEGVEKLPQLVGVSGGAEGPAPAGYHSWERLRRWLEADVLSPPELGQVELGIGFGVPGIEICRFAERIGADLLILGGKRHSQRARLLLGDTADAVARRSRFPCLFVPSETRNIRSMLVALDGSDRGMSVLYSAFGLFRRLGMKLQVVTAERGLGNEPSHLASALPSTRTSALQARVLTFCRREEVPEIPVIVRREEISEAVLAAVRETRADVLAIGYHRGGPPGVLEAGSTARRLVHAAPSAVLTIPL